MLEKASSYRICQNDHQQHACGPTSKKSGVELEREAIWVLGWSLISLILRESVYHLVWVPFPWQYGMWTRERLVFSLIWECDWEWWGLECVSVSVCVCVKEGNPLLIETTQR